MPLCAHIEAALPRDSERLQRRAQRPLVCGCEVGGLDRGPCLFARTVPVRRGRLCAGRAAPREDEPRGPTRHLSRLWCRRRRGPPRRGRPRARHHVEKTTPPTLRVQFTLGTQAARLFHHRNRHHNTTSALGCVTRARARGADRVHPSGSGAFKGVGLGCRAHGKWVLPVSWTGAWRDWPARHKSHKSASSAVAGATWRPRHLHSSAQTPRHHPLVSPAHDGRREAWRRARRQQGGRRRRTRSHRQAGVGPGRNAPILFRLSTAAEVEPPGMRVAGQVEPLPRAAWDMDAVSVCGYIGTPRAYHVGRLEGRVVAPPDVYHRTLRVPTLGSHSCQSEGRGLAPSPSGSVPHVSTHDKGG